MASESLEAALCEEFGIERETVEWSDYSRPETKYWVSAEPGPVLERTLPDAIRRSVLIEVQDALREHWLMAVDCDHEAKTDTARCYCTVWTGTAQPSVGQAVNEWIRHVISVLPKPDEK